MHDAKLIDRDLGKLHPAFARRVEELLRGMWQLGHDAMVWEGFRTFERAAELARKGTGVERSMHCYGLAVDIIDRKLQWKASAEFWRDLQHLATELGLTSGATFSRDDRPHVQALPARLDGWVRRHPADVSARVERQLGGV